MTDDAFLADIIENPEDDAVRLVYSDWLEDHGRPERAEFIRVQCELAGLPEGGPRRQDLEDRERVLLERHREEWAGPVRGLVESCTFRRGFVEAVDVEPAAFLARAESLFAAAPVRHARFRFGFDRDDLEGEVARLAGSPHLGRLRTLGLNFGPCCVLDGGLQTLARRPRLLRRLTSLEAVESHLGVAGLRPVLTSPHLARLRSLELDDCTDLRAGQAVPLVCGSPLLGGLTRLWLPCGGVGDEGACRLAGSLTCRSLESLHLVACGVGDAGAAALASSPHLRRLRKLFVWKNDIGEEGVERLKARFGDRVHF